MAFFTRLTPSLRLERLLRKQAVLLSILSSLAEAAEAERKDQTAGAAEAAVAEPGGCCLVLLVLMPVPILLSSAVADQKELAGIHQERLPAGMAETLPL